MKHGELGASDAESDEIIDNWMTGAQYKAGKAGAEITVNPHRVHRVERSAGEPTLGTKGRTIVLRGEVHPKPNLSMRYLKIINTVLQWRNYE